MGKVGYENRLGYMQLQNIRLVYCLYAELTIKSFQTITFLFKTV